ncbi:hypothetical protein I307_01666 [Cryptococcus deuterogattii 99/473]|uniref:Uncharacterized protein n=2 Tax=Cryptococcus deuterogattii TaxID=1859096 RepID=A0A0D0UUR1_9TREE|nr:hypothetical protein I309_04192 [Cryptococcus deuterogattii LA55]KIR36553.1 hypothetical protein I352_01506 [Cryptococcus deuterogattii MMRL2647]KIR38956.1 hypothetical protein I313_05100 [Cryptococcus deuterogattii Ram5]KIR75983.1 hypothetical protein I310_00685 [Cryptococcus deuterogattii CA1014]KIR95926.1 hypothetical protein I304_00686 [Cryptococcus deuterogattii CBS 10090]KIS02422.1 hypothetical protein L804_00687 [Cryptococcus deuterogattii 2001/935-1]KIY58869.1 hypothetical protein 
MVKSALFFFTFMAFATFVCQAAEAPAPGAISSRDEYLSNAERLRRGLPLKKPKRYYDPTRPRPNNTPVPSPMKIV